MSSISLVGITSDQKSEIEPGIVKESLNKEQRSEIGEVIENIIKRTQKLLNALEFGNLQNKHRKTEEKDESGFRDSGDDNSPEKLLDLKNKLRHTLGQMLGVLRKYKTEKKADIKKLQENTKHFSEDPQFLVESMTKEGVINYIDEYADILKDILK